MNNKLSFLMLVLIGGTCWQLFSMDREAFSGSQNLRQAMYAGSQALNERLQRDGVKTSKIIKTTSRARNDLGILQQALLPELERRVAHHDGHTVAPLINNILTHADQSLLHAQQYMENVPLYNEERDGIANHGVVLAIGAHAEGLAILERLFGIVNNAPSAFRNSGENVKNLFAGSSLEKKLAFLKMIKEHYQRWFGGARPRAAAVGLVVPVPSTSAHRVQAPVVEESGCSATAAPAEEVPALGAEWLADAAYCREYIHDLYQQLIIALGNVDVLLDDLSDRLPIDRGQEGAANLDPQFALVHTSLRSFSAGSRKLQQICHDGYTEILPKAVPSIETVIFHLEKNRTTLRDLAHQLTPKLASGIQGAIWGAEQAGVVKDVCSYTKKSPVVAWSSLKNVASAAAWVFSSLSEEEIERQARESLKEEEAEEKQEKLCPRFACQNEKDEEEKSKKENAEAIVHLVANISLLLEDLSPVVGDCLEQVVKIKEFTKDSDGHLSIPSVLRKSEQKIAAVMVLTEQLREILCHRFTRDESFGSPAFKAWMEAVAQPWQQRSEPVVHEIRPPEQLPEATSSANDGDAAPAPVDSDLLNKGKETA